MKPGHSWTRVTFAVIAMCLLLLGVPYVFARTLGTAPQLNRAVQGQTGAQPEGRSSTLLTGSAMSFPRWEREEPCLEASSRIYATRPFAFFVWKKRNPCCPPEVRFAVSPWRAPAANAGRGI